MDSGGRTRSAGGPRRPRAPRAADQGRLRREERADAAGRRRPRVGQRARRRGRRARGTRGGAAATSRREGTSVMNEHVLSMHDLTAEDVTRILDTAELLPRGGHARDQEGPGPPRPHGRELLPRELDADADLLRAGGQAPVGRRDQLQRRWIQVAKGESPEGHRADAAGDGRRRDRDPALLERLAAAADAVGGRARPERRRRHARASDAGPAGPLHDAREARAPRGPPRGDRGRRPALARGAIAVVRAGEDGRRGHARRAADPDPAGRAGVGRAGQLRPRGGPAQAGRLLHAARPAGAAAPGVLPERPRVRTAVRRSPASAWACCPRGRSSCIRGR